MKKKDKGIRPTSTIQESEKILSLADKYGINIKKYLDMNGLRILHHLLRYIFISENISKKSKVIDIGTGEAVSLYQIYKRVPNAKITGADVDEDSLEIARKNIPNAFFIKGDVEDYSNYDVAVCCELIGNKSIKSDKDFLMKLNQIKRVFVSIPCYKGRKKKKYFGRTYDNHTFKKLINTCFKGSKIEFYGQFHPVNYTVEDFIGIWPNPELIKDCDFMICKITK